MVHNLGNNMRIFAILLLAFSSLYSRTKDGLIYSGFDTIHYSHYYGFDFYAQKPCLIADLDPSCYSHFKFVHLEFIGKYLSAYVYKASLYGKSMLYRKANLDSIKTAPHDSIWARYLQDADTIPDDSLVYTIGDIFLIKSGPDPRLGSPLYAKIKIRNYSRSSEHNRLRSIYC